MADVITKFKVDTGDFDRKVKGAKKSVDDFSKAGKSANDTMNGLGSALGINVGALGKMSVAFAAASTAAKVAKDAFMSLESNIDELGRTTEGAKGAYSAFLDTINGGNWSDFLRNIASAVRGARDLYDALDNLSSIKTNNSAAIAIQQQAIAELKRRQNNGENVAEDMKAATALLEQLRSESVVAGKTAGRKSMYNTIRNKVNGMVTSGVSDDQINAAISAILGETPMNVGGRDMVGNSVVGYYAAMAKDLEALGTKTRIQLTDDGRELRIQEFSIKNLDDANKALYALAKAIAEGETQYQEGINIYAQAVNEQTATSKEVTKAEKIAAKSEGTTTAKGASYVDQMNAMNHDARAWAMDAVTTSYALNTDMSLQEALQREIDNMDAIKVPVEIVIDEDGIDEDLEPAIKSAADMTSAWRSAASAVSAVGGALQQIDNPAAKVMGIIAEAIANVALGLGEMLAQPASTSEAWGWVALAASGTATMISTIAAIKSATSGSYATGGFISGVETGGADSVWAHVSPGELVLNRAQQANLAGQLSQNNITGMHLETYISGEDIRIALNNSARRRGGSRGEYAISR